jgi:hypothetical protein
MSRNILLIGRSSRDYWQNIYNAPSSEATSSQSTNIKWLNKKYFINNYICILATAIGRNCIEKNEINNIFSIFGISKEDEIIVISHKCYDDNSGTKTEDLDQIKKNFNNLLYLLYLGYDAENNEPLNKIIYPFNNNFQNYDNWTDAPTWEAILDIVNKENIIQPLCYLKHRIMHFFHALDLDLQNLWLESKRLELSDFKSESWEEIIDDYKYVDWDSRFDEIEKTINDIFKINVESLNKLMGIKMKAIILLNYLKENRKKEVFKSINDNNGNNILNEYILELEKILTSLFKNS